MGLDVVELVMRVEEEFSIDLPDEEAANATTVGRLYELVLSKLSTQQPPSAAGNVITKEQVWTKLVLIISDQLQIDESEIVPTARFLEDLGAD